MSPHIEGVQPCNDIEVTNPCPFAKNDMSSVEQGQSNPDLAPDSIAENDAIQPGLSRGWERGYQE